MGSVELSEHFGKQVLEVKVVVDMRQERHIVVMIVLPVNSLNVFYIELLFDLFPHMLEHVCALFCRPVFILARKCYAFGLSSGKREF